MPRVDPPASTRARWQPFGSREDAILHAAAYVTAVCVTVAELVSLPLGWRFAGTAALLAGFLVVLAVTLRAAHQGGTRSVVVCALTAWVVAGAIVAVGASPSVGAVLFFVICSIAAMRLPARAAVAWVVASIGALAASLAVHGEPWLPTVADFSIGFFAFFAISVSFRRSLQLRAESQQLLAELTRTQGRLQEMAVMEERERLAREMHDAVGHRLTAASMLLEGAGRLISSEPERASRMVETSRTQIRQGLDELRAAVSALHSPPVDGQSVREILAALVEVFRHSTGAAVTLEIEPGMAEPDPDRKLVIVRTCQEALTNVQKHAGATRVELSLKEEAGAYRLVCRDNGRGIAPGSDADSGSKRNGFGLGNLRARAQPFGGRVDLESVPDGGAVLRLTLPLALPAPYPEERAPRG